MITSGDVDNLCEAVRRVAESMAKHGVLELRTPLLEIRMGAAPMVVDHAPTERAPVRPEGPPQTMAEYVEAHPDFEYFERNNVLPGGSL